MITATSHRYSKSYPNNVFFTMVDFDKGSDVFQSVGGAGVVCDAGSQWLRAGRYRNSTEMLYIDTTERRDSKNTRFC